MSGSRRAAITARAAWAARAFSSHRASFALSSPAPARASQTATSRSRATVLAASRAQAGTPPRLPMAPGAAATSASRSARSRPTHQACTASGAAPAGGAVASAASAGSARPPSCSRTCSTREHAGQGRAHRLLLGGQVGQPALELRLEATHRRGVLRALLDQGGDQLRGDVVSPQHQGRGPVDQVPALLEQPEAPFEQLRQLVGVPRDAPGDGAQGQRHRVGGGAEAPDRLVVRRGPETLPVADPGPRGREAAEVVELRGGGEEVDGEVPDPGRVGDQRGHRARPGRRQDEVDHRSALLPHPGLQEELAVAGRVVRHEVVGDRGAQGLG